MLISEVIATMQARLATHGDKRVKATWQGTLEELDPSRFYLSKDGDLLIDADGNDYKADLAADPNEGKSGV